MKKELEKVYDPKQVEDKTYRFWMENAFSIDIRIYLYIIIIYSINT